MLIFVNKSNVLGTSVSFLVIGTTNKSLDDVFFRIVTLKNLFGLGVDSSNSLVEAIQGLKFCRPATQYPCCYECVPAIRESLRL